MKSLIGLMIMGLVSVKASANVANSFDCSISQQVADNGKVQRTVYSAKRLEISDEWQKIEADIPQFNANYPNDKLHVQAFVKSELSGRNLIFNVNVLDQSNVIASGRGVASMKSDVLQSDLSSLQGVQFSVSMICKR